MSDRLEDITRAFDALRTQCDPRGHDLLKTLEHLCIVNESILDGILAPAEMQTPTNILSLTDRIERYGVKA